VITRPPTRSGSRVIVWVVAAALASAACLDAAVATRAAAAEEAEKEDCFSCHASETEVEDPKLVVEQKTWTATVHGAVGCLACHGDEDDDAHTGVNPGSRCPDCHREAADGVRESVHARTESRIAAKKHPRCASCHGPVHTMPAGSDPASPVHPVRVADTCGKCHADPALAAEAEIKLVQPMAAYDASVHAKAIAEGKEGATCSSCHASHDIRSSADARSRVHRANVPTTCGGCHEAIAATFAASVHGQASARGIAESPVCTDCHGEHRILGPADQGSPVFATKVPKVTCGRCHGDLRLTEKFALDVNAVAAFEDSFHGLASRTGSVSVANCASCHGVHDILPSSDPRSHVHPANLASTCGACHPGAGTTFAIGPVHVVATDRASAHPAVYWVRLAYVWVIWLVVGGMVLHNALDLRRKALSPQPRPVLPLEARRWRMAAGFRVAHALVLVSFAVLVWTGFALTYPDSWWSAPLLVWEGRFALRGSIHRGAALVMLAGFAFHAVHLAVDRRARACIRRMRPTRDDFRELRERVRWFFGARPDMPHAPALGYAEKVEYLALIWGTVIMALSGFVLWFSDWSLAYLPKWASDVATVVHFYEAVLATLAILVWHFYFVMFDPLVYPMDGAWISGREAPGRTLERIAATIEPDDADERPPS
jgi:cytochrome b subunit of formate dehydrogenase